MRGCRPRRGMSAITLAVLLTGFVVGRARGQAMLADDVIILSKGQRAKAALRAKAAGGDPTPGSGASLLPPPPGLGLSMPGLGRMAARQVQASSPANGVLNAASGYSAAFSGRPEQPQFAPLPAPAAAPAPIYGTLEVPAADDEGPPGGLSLDQAIDRLVHGSPDLAARSRELPKSQADVLTAGLIANPIVFFSADSIPYGSYSPQRPGSNSYGIVLVQPIDANGKRRARVIVAEQARRVVEAQYQDAVRLAIDGLGTAFVDVLEARENLRYKQANLARLNDVVKATRGLFERGDKFRIEYERTQILRDSAEVELQAAEAAELRARQALASLLHIPPAEAAALEVRGSIRDNIPPPPPVEELVCLATINRPDVVAYRLGVHRAESEVRLARRERFEDVFLFYTPYGFANYAPVGENSATSWSLGGLVSIPILNRNQGNIARAQHVVIQTKIEMEAISRQVATEVQQAYLDYQTTRTAAERIDREILPRARKFRDDNYKLFTAGEQDITVYFNAERDYNDVVRQFRDTLVRHRRSMLRLNTAVGHRILP